MASTAQVTSSTCRPPDYSAKVSMTRLTELEAVIELGIKTFVEVGSALMEIRDKRLYREKGFSTFEDYCHKRWNWSRRHANRQIQAAKIVAVAGPRGPKNEKQARELAGLEPEEIKQVVEKVDFSTAAAKEVRRVVQKMRPTSIIPESRELDGPGSVADTVRGHRTVQLTKREELIAESNKRRMVEGVSLVAGACKGLNGLNVAKLASRCSKSELEAWIEKTQEARTALGQFKSNLQKELQDGNFA